MRQFLTIAALSLALAGCQTASAPPPVAINASFNPAEAAFIKTKGKGTIEGHAFLREKSGGTQNAAGEVVRLIPATAYARERFAKLYGDRKFVPVFAYPKTQDTDPRYPEFIRTTKAESNGKFSFANVAPGTYFVSTQVTWQPAGALVQEGGAMYELVTVTGKEEEAVEVVVSGT